MIYCFNFSNSSNDRLQKEINRAKKEGNFLYYDEDNDLFLDMNNQAVSVKDLSIIPISGVFQLPKVIEALTREGAVLPNFYEDILKIEEWYSYINTNREIVSFKGKDLEDAAFLTYLIELFYGQEEVFLKTVKKDFNGIVKLKDLINEESDLRKTFSYHLEDGFLLSNKVLIDKDSLGKIEYRAFIMNNKIMNISRITDQIYHNIPDEVLTFYQHVMKELPSDFPYSYVLDVFSHDGNLDILEFNPIETSGKYLYNTVFQYSEDLLHHNLENIPIEKENVELHYGPIELKTPSTTTNKLNSFAKDYNDVKSFGTRINGFAFVDGLPAGTKLDLYSIFKNSKIISSDISEVSDQKTFSKK